MIQWLCGSSSREEVFPLPIGVREVSAGGAMQNAMSWKQLVAEALRQMGGHGALREITERLRDNPIRPQTATWEATIRRVVRQYRIFEPFKDSAGRAAYRLVQQREIESPQGGEFKDPHGEQQGMLLQLGRICGYETFTNATDRTVRKMGAVPIAEFTTVRNDSESLRGLPLERIRNIDIMWMAEDAEGLYPMYAFEVEESTKVKNGLLRLLKIPHRYGTRLYIVGRGEEEANLYRRYVEESPFREHAERLRFRKYEDVRAFHASATKFDKVTREFGVNYNRQ